MNLYLTCKINENYDNYLSDETDERGRGGTEWNSSQEGFSISRNARSGTEGECGQPFFLRGAD